VSSASSVVERLILQRALKPVVLCCALAYVTVVA
jgi:hypothetical protein